MRNAQPCESPMRLGTRPGIEPSRARRLVRPGTAIPVVEESRLFTDQPDAAIVFSWHIADELAPKLRANGYRGKLISPLPAPREL